jgi:hypothetical protein
MEEGSAARLAELKRKRDEAYDLYDRLDTEVESAREAYKDDEAKERMRNFDGRHVWVYVNAYRSIVRVFCTKDEADAFNAQNPSPCSPVMVAVSHRGDAGCGYLRKSETPS